MGEGDEAVRSGKGNTERILEAISRLDGKFEALKTEQAELKKQFVTCHGDQCKIVEDKSKATDAKLADVDKKIEALKADLGKKVSEDGLLTRTLSYQVLNRLKGASGADTAECPKCGHESPLPAGIEPGDELQCEKCGHKVVAQPDGEEDAEEEEAGDEESAGAGDPK